MMSESIRDGYKMTELGELPEEWEFDILNNLTDKITDGTHHTPNYSDYGIPFLRVTDIQSNNIDFNEIKYISSDEHRELIKRCKPEKRDILYSKNGTIGITKIIDWDWDFSIFVSLCLIKTEHEKIRTDYLFYLLNSNIIKKQILMRSKQMTVTNLHLEEIKKFQIPLPPFPEQHRIAEILFTIDETIERTEVLIEKYRHIKAGLMSDLLTRGIDEEGRIRSEETHEFKDSPLGRVSQEWMVGTLSDIARIEMGQSPGGNTYNSVGNGKPLLNGPVEFGVYHPTPIQWTSKPTKMCNQKDILFCVRGSTTGRMNIANRKYCIGRGIAAICGILNISDTSYIKYYLDRENQFIFSLATGGGSTFPNITNKDLSNLPCMYPSLSEQHRIAEILTTADTYIEKEQNYLNKLQQIKKGLMQDLLTGKVRVTITPTPSKPAEAAT